MAELVEEDDAEESQVFEDVPQGRAVVVFAGLDLECGNEKPRPVEIDGDAGNAEDAERALAGEHAGSLLDCLGAVEKSDSGRAGRENAFIQRC